MSQEQLEEEPIKEETNIEENRTEKQDIDEKPIQEQQPTTSIADNENIKKENNTSKPGERRGKYYIETLGVEDITYGFTEIGYGTTEDIKRTKEVLLKQMLFDCGCIEPPPKIAVLGARETGMALTAALLSMNIAYNIVICELDETAAEIADIETCIMGPNIYGHGVSICTKLESIVGSAIVIITRDFGKFGYSGRAEFTDAIETIQNNLLDILSLTSAICKLCPDAIIINHVYPTELSTRWAYLASAKMEPAWNACRFIGLGTAVHSARFRRGLAAKLGVSPTDCEAVILGREGRTSVPIWSSVSVAGVKLQDLNEDIGTDDDQDNYVLLHIDSAGMDELLVRHRGEPSNYAPAVIMARLVYAILHNTREVFTICTFVKGCRHGEKQDVFMSLPCVIGRTGVQRIVKQRMSESEKDAMQESAQKIYNFYVQFETGTFTRDSDSDGSDDEHDRYKSTFDDESGLKCINQCSCLDDCKENQKATCAKCCGGADECINSKRHKIFHNFPRQKLRGAGGVDCENSEIWKYARDSVIDVCNKNRNLKVSSRFQGLIEAHESAACQSDMIVEDYKMMKRKVMIEDCTSTEDSAVDQNNTN